MKHLIFILGIFLSSKAVWAEDFVLFLVDPEDSELLEIFENDEALQESPEDLNELEQYLNSNKLPMEEKYERLAALSFKRQQYLVALLDEFVGIQFNPRDPEANPHFVETTRRIVKTTFQSMSEKDYYDSFFIINQTWLDNEQEVERFAYLDNELSRENLRREKRRIQIRKIATTVTTLGGAALGVYGGYLASKKVVPIKADEKTLGLFLKWGGRIPMIILGASVGAAAGSYLGFLGSNWLMQRQRQYIDPIDGNEDLRDILDIIDELP